MSEGNSRPEPVASDYIGLDGDCGVQLRTALGMSTAQSRASVAAARREQERA